MGRGHTVAQSVHRTLNGVAAIQTGSGGEGPNPISSLKKLVGLRPLQWLKHGPCKGTLNGVATRVEVII